MDEGQRSKKRNPPDGKVLVYPLLKRVNRVLSGLPSLLARIVPFPVPGPKIRAHPGRSAPRKFLPRQTQPKNPDLLCLLGFPAECILPNHRGPSSAICRCSDNEKSKRNAVRKGLP